MSSIRHHPAGGALWYLSKRFRRSKKDHDSIQSELEHFANYPGVEEDDTAEQEIVKHINAGRLAAFNTIEETRKALGGNDPILNKIGIITKERAGTIKNTHDPGYTSVAYQGVNVQGPESVIA